MSDKFLKNFDGCKVQIVTDTDSFLGIASMTSDSDWLKLDPYEDDKLDKEYGFSVSLTVYKRISDVQAIIILDGNTNKENENK